MPTAQNTQLLKDIDAARETVKQLCHDHWPDPEVRERIELACAHLIAAWRVVAHGKADPSDDPDATHQAIRAFTRLEKHLIEMA